MQTAQPHPIRISAHRAWHQDGAPKNSMAALEAAARNGVDSVETDIRRLGDETLVVFHDKTWNGVALSQLDRTTMPTDGSMPLLDDWARRAGELDTRVLVELKEAGYEQDVIDVVHRYVARDKAEWFSFQRPAVSKLAELLPDRPVGFLTDLGGGSALPVSMERVARDIGDARRLGATFLGINHRQSRDAVISAIHGAGLDVVVWPDTPNPETLDDVARLIDDPRVKTYVTDVPELAMRLRAAGSAGSDLAEAGVRFLRAVATMR